MSVIPIRRNQAGEAYQKIQDVLNDALDGAWFFVKGVEVDYRYVMTAQVREIIDLMVQGEIRRSEVARG